MQIKNKKKFVVKNSARNYKLEIKNKKNLK